jgi:hypothetical protein
VVFKYTNAAGSELTGVIEFGTVTPGANPADFNNDGSVNGADLTIWRNNFGSTTATKPTGDADTDGDTDGNDFLVWQRNVGATAASASAAAVPEPTAIALLAIAGLGLVLRRGRLTKASFPASPAGGAAAVGVALAVILTAGAVNAAVTVDRHYRLGEEPGEGGPGAPATVGSIVGSGNSFMTTWDSQPPGFHDLVQNGGAVYVNVGPTGLARPGATATESLGVQFDGTDDYLRGLRFNFPGNSASSTLNCCYIIEPATTPAPGPNNYVGLSNRGFQTWVRPEGPAPSRVQNVVLDTNQQGLLISATNNWVMRYNGADTTSTKPVAFNAWSHAMVVRPFGATGPTGGSILYINGEAVAARTGGYNADQEFALVLGADTGDGTADPIGGDSAAYYKGVLDDLSLFVMGKTYDGVDRGTFNFRTDNAWAATHLTPPIADVNQDGAVNQTDVNTMVANWKFTNLVNGVQAGDMITITKGDLNFDGAVNLKDAAMLRTAIGSPSSLAGIDLSLLPVPEPASLTLASAVVAMVMGVRRKKRTQITTK